jgi:hypothetical protein
MGAGWAHSTQVMSSPEGVKGTLSRDRSGKLTQPVDLAAWERRTRERFGFLTDLDDDERRWAACDPRHRREVGGALAAGGFPAS